MARQGHGDRDVAGPGQDAGLQVGLVQAGLRAAGGRPCCGPGGLRWGPGPWAGGGDPGGWAGTDRAVDARKALR